MYYTDKTIGVGESSEEFTIVGNCDLWVSGLTSGSVKLEVKFPGTGTFIDMPDGEFTSDVTKTIFLSEHGVKCRLTGVGNNAGVYVRLARFKN